MNKGKAQPLYLNFCWILYVLKEKTWNSTTFLGMLVPTRYARLDIWIAGEF